MPTPEEIARAVWEYESRTNKLKFGDMLRVTYNAIRYGKKGVRHHGAVTADFINRFNELKAMVAAQNSTIEALAKNVGADPASISKIVSDSVEKTMSQVILTVDFEGDEERTEG